MNTTAILSLLIAPISTLIGIWLTNKYNFKNLGAQHLQQLKKEKLQREYEFKKEIFHPVLTEIVKIQQTLGFAIGGGVTQNELLKRAKACGLAVAGIQLVAHPETVRLVQRYALLCNRTLQKEMPFNLKTAQCKKAFEVETDEAKKKKLGQEHDILVLAGIDRVTPEIAKLIKESIPVMIAIRGELGIDTSLVDFSLVLNEIATEGEKMMLELSEKLKHGLDL